jgi:MFS transporter, AAHS family, benzoate transport protein
MYSPELLLCVSFLRGMQSCHTSELSNAGAMKRIQPLHLFQVQPMVDATMPADPLDQNSAPDFLRFCSEVKFNRFHALVVFLGMLTLVFDGYYSQIISYVMPDIIREWRLSPVEAGLIASYGLVGLMIGTAGFGMLADRIGRKIPLMMALFLFSFFGGALYWAQDFRSFCILRFLSGLGIGGVLTLAITLATEFAPARIRASMVAGMFAGFMVGPALAGLLSMIFVPAYGWRIVFLFAYVPLLLLPVLHFFMPESIRFLAQKGRFHEAIKVLRRLERSAGVPAMAWTERSFVLPAAETASLKHLFASNLTAMTLLIWFVYFCNLLVIYGLTTWLPTLLVSEGISAVRSYGYTSLNHIGGAIGAVVLGFVMDRFGRKSGLVFSYLLAAVSVWLYGYVTGSPLALYVVGAAAGFFVNGAQSAQHAVTAEVYPTVVRSTGVGWALTMGRFGAVCGPLLGGFLQAERYSFRQYFGIFAAPCILCTVLVCFYRVNVKGETLETVEAKIRNA